MVHHSMPTLLRRPVYMCVHRGSTTVGQTYAMCHAALSAQHWMRAPLVTTSAGMPCCFRALAARSTEKVRCSPSADGTHASRPINASLMSRAHACLVWSGLVRWAWAGRSRSGRQWLRRMHQDTPACAVWASPCELSTSRPLSRRKSKDMCCAMLRWGVVWYGAVTCDVVWHCMAWGPDARYAPENGTPHCTDATPSKWEWRASN